MYGPPAEAAIPPPPPTPAQMPPVPANVAYQNGLLTIAAENSTMADVLTQVRAKTGATIEFPPAANSQRVVIHAGPAPPREALSALLAGSGFDYVILGSDQEPDGVQRVIITQRQPGAARAANATAPPSRPVREPTGDPDVDDTPTQEIVQPQIQPQPSVVPQSMPPRQQPAAGTPPQPNSDQQQVKTPQELLQELQRLQQQRQQGNQQVPH